MIHVSQIHLLTCSSAFFHRCLASLIPFYLLQQHQLHWAAGQVTPAVFEVLLMPVSTLDMAGRAEAGEMTRQKMLCHVCSRLSRVSLSSIKTLQNRKAKRLWFYSIGLLISICF